MKARGELLLALGLGLGALGCASRASRAAWLDRPLSGAVAPEAAPDEPLPADPLADLLQRGAAVRGLEPGPLPALISSNIA